MWSREERTAVVTAAGSPLRRLLAARVGRYGFVGKRIAALATIGYGAGGVRETPTREVPEASPARPRSRRHPGSPR